MIREVRLDEISQLKVHGRTTGCLTPLTLFWTASGFECNVSGSELAVEVEVTYDTYEPWYSYTVNGDWIARSMLPKGRYWITLFRGMSPTDIKNVRFYKDTQAMNEDVNDVIRIHQLRLDGEFYKVDDKRIKMEFIGDSITSGEGLFGAKEDMDWIPMYFSALRDYSYLTAKEMDAEYRVISQSGWGVYCGWDNDTRHNIPTYYEQVCGLMNGGIAKENGSMEKHDFSTWQPDYVIVNLGTNDASAFSQPPFTDPVTGLQNRMTRPDGIGKIKTAIKQFLTMIRKNNPQAKIIWCYGMVDDAIGPDIREAVEQYSMEEKDEKIYYLHLEAMTDDTIGSRQHPGSKCHELAAKKVIKYIKEL